MFGVSGTELLLVVLVALVVFGPSRLPEIARAIKAGYRELTKVRQKVDETLTELRQEIDLNLDAPPAKPAIRPAAASIGSPRYPEAKSGAQLLPVPDEDDYLAPGAVRSAASGEYTTDDYLREAGQ